MTSNLNRNICIVVRSVSERTEQECLNIIKRQGFDYFLIKEMPFQKAIERTFQIGLENRDRNILLAMDADVLLFRNSISDIIYFIKNNKYNFFRYDFKVIDKFRGIINAGVHGYINKYSENVIDYIKCKNLFIPPYSHRPESTILKEFSKKNKLKSIIIDYPIVGIHDYEQFYSDIISKYYNRCVKDYAKKEVLKNMLLNQLKNYEDMDIRMALYGLTLVKSKNDSIRLDKNLYFPKENLNNFGLNEKEELHFKFDETFLSFNKN